MSILFDPQKKLLTLTTANTGYQMQIDDLGFLRHLYYGSSMGLQDMSYQFYDFDHAFSGNPIERRRERTFSLDFVISSPEMTAIRPSFGATFFVSEHAPKIRQAPNKTKPICFILFPL